MMEFLGWLESTAVSLWMRETLYAFPLVLTVHSIGMGFLVGVNIAVALRRLGIAGKVPPEAMNAFVPVIWVSFIAILASGVLLLFAYPAKALTNPVFYLKLTLAAGAFAASWLLLGRATLPVAAAASRRFLPAVAVAALVLWAGVIATGRFLAYTHSVLLVSDSFR